MKNARRIRQLSESRPTLEGAGVHLRRAFGFDEVPLFDPFLLLDDFRSDNPGHYLLGFPWHPHRGIETITYMLRGRVEHGDSLGNVGTIRAGDVQWMTAGSGIIHQEMPMGDPDGAMGGFQLWTNLPASHKMTDPLYRDVRTEQIPEAALEGGARARVIAGTIGDVQGPVRDIVVDPELLDVAVPPGSALTHPTKRGHKVFAYVIEGRGHFEGAEVDPAGSPSGNGSLILFDDGDEMAVRAGNQSLRFLLVSGKPIGEPIAWHGPIVMNTEEELALAFDEYRRGTFIRRGR